MGRKKIEIKPITKPGVKRATFEKRSVGVFKKAMELSILCDSIVSVTIQKPNGQLQIYSSHPFQQFVVDRFKNFKGTYKLYTNDHINKMIPGKKNVAGYTVIKDDKKSTIKPDVNHRPSVITQPIITKPLMTKPILTKSIMPNSLMSNKFFSKPLMPNNGNGFQGTMLTNSVRKLQTSPTFNQILLIPPTPVGFNGSLTLQVPTPTSATYIPPPLSTSTPKFNLDLNINQSNWTTNDFSPTNSMDFTGGTTTTDSYSEYLNTSISSNFTNDVNEDMDALDSQTKKRTYSDLFFQESMSKDEPKPKKIRIESDFF